MTATPSTERAIGTETDRQPQPTAIAIRGITKMFGPVCAVQTPLSLSR